MKKSDVTKTILAAGVLTLAATAAAVAGIQMPPTKPPMNVPEPGALTLIGAGLAALIIGNRLRKRK